MRKRMMMMMAAGRPVEQESGRHEDGWRMVWVGGSESGLDKLWSDNMGEERNASTLIHSGLGGIG